MISCTQLVDEAMVEIRPDAGGRELFGARVGWSSDGKEFRPCRIFRGRGHDDLLECTFWEWNQAAEHGNVRWDGRPRAVYWNLYLDGMHLHRGPVTIRVEALGRESVEIWERSVDLVPSAAVFLADWERCASMGEGWKVTDAGLTFAGGAAAAPAEVRPGASGVYDVYFGLQRGTLMSRVWASGEPARYPFTAPVGRAEFQDKHHKEVRWKALRLREDSRLHLAPFPLTEREPKVHPFGAVAYIKLVPVRAAPRPPKAWRDRALALYFEPYSWSFSYGIRDRSELREALHLYREMGATEVHNQVVRFGSKTLHHSRVVERDVDPASLMGDDGTFSPGPALMVKSLDVLRESIDLCRELGMRHYANAGLTNCYPGSGFEERISREHPEWRQGNILRFNRPETRAYAAAIVREFVEWGSDGVSIDCMRYPYHHTEEDLLALFGEIHDAIRAAAGGRSVPLTARIPAGDVVYYRVFERLVRSGVVGCVVPSGLFMREPWFSLEPYLKWKDFGCRVLGIIDGWLAHVGSFGHYQLSLNRNPRDIREDMERFLSQGADGIYVYQADGHLADAFTREVFRDAGVGAPAPGGAP